MMTPSKLTKRERAERRAATASRHRERYKAECERTRAMPHLSDDKLERLFVALRKAHAGMSSALVALSTAESPAQLKAMQAKVDAAKRQLMHVQRAIGAIDANATDIAGKARFDVLPKYTGRTR